MRSGRPYAPARAAASAPLSVPARLPLSASTSAPGASPSSSSSPKRCASGEVAGLTTDTSVAVNESAGRLWEGARERESDARMSSDALPCTPPSHDSSSRDFMVHQESLGQEIRTFYRTTLSMSQITRPALASRLVDPVIIARRRTDLLGQRTFSMVDPQQRTEAEHALGVQADRAAQRGDTETVIKLMRAHPSSPYLNMVCLFNLSQHLKAHNGVAQSFEAAGVTALALAALRTHGKWNQGVAGNACCLLGNQVLLGEPCSPHFLAANGGLELILQALLTHHSDTHNCGITSAYAVIALGLEPCTAAILVDMGAVDLLLHVMAAHKTHTGMLCKCTRALGVLLGHPDVDLPVEIKRSYQRGARRAAKKDPLTMVAQALSCAAAPEGILEDDADGAYSERSLLAEEALFCMNCLLKHKVLIQRCRNVRAVCSLVSMVAQHFPTSDVIRESAAAAQRAMAQGSGVDPEESDDDEDEDEEDEDEGWLEEDEFEAAQQREE